MTDPTPTPDPEFEEFLKRRRPLFRRDVDDGLEPPPELDRIVLRQAREAIRADEPLQMYRGPRWAAPLAIAATLLLGLAVVFQVADQQRQAIPEVSIENVAQRVEPGAQAASPAVAANQSADSSGGTATASPRVEIGAPRHDEIGATAAEPRQAPPRTLAKAPWRRDAQAWMAEIERLRAAGDHARAEAEMAEYNRAHRAFAASPDR